MCVHVVVLLVLLLLFSIIDAVEITSPPQNAVVLTGSTVQLTCGINEQYTGYFEWRAYFAGKLGGQQIYSSSANSFVSSAPKYRKFGDFGLEIEAADWRDAGKYSCVFLTGDVRATASIVVIGKWKTALNEILSCCSKCSSMLCCSINVFF